MQTYGTGDDEHMGSTSTKFQNKSFLLGTLRIMAKSNHPNLLFTSAIMLTLGACSANQGFGPSTTTMDAQTQATPAAGAPGAQGNVAQLPGQPAAPAKAFNRFPDIPVPTGAVMDVKRTIVFGGGESWYGQLGLDANHDTGSMFDFYKQELPAFNWQEVTSVRAPVSVLTYERQGRILSIQLEQATLSGTKVTLTVSPRGGNAPVM
ncbi:hypothetical protein ACFL12_07495 [Pseudomonadota bacterium]